MIKSAQLFIYQHIKLPTNYVGYWKKMHIQDYWKFCVILMLIKFTKYLLT